MNSKLSRHFNFKGHFNANLPQLAIRKPIESAAMRVVNRKENDEYCFLALLRKVEFTFKLQL